MTDLLPITDDILAGLIQSKMRAEKAARSLVVSTQFQCSNAYACSRQLAYRALDVPKDIVYTAEEIATFRTGDAYHHMAKEAAVRALNASCEMPVDWTGTVSLSGFCDGVYVLSRLRGLVSDHARIVEWFRSRHAFALDKVAVEVKSMADYGFELATGMATKRGNVAGPKYADLLQCGLYALSPQIDAKWCHIVYIDKETDAVAEWIVGVDEELPHLGWTVRAMVEKELDRLADIAKQIDDGDLPARVVPGFGVVQSPPARGSKGEPWSCRYCSWQPTCDATGEAGPVEGWVTAYLMTKGTK